MKDETPHLMTAAEFNAQVRRWADEIKAMAQMTLAAGTHGTGRLREELAAFVDKATHLTASMESDGVEVVYKAKFGFDRYGVFRAYGVGRGWSRVGGVAVKSFSGGSQRAKEEGIWDDLRRSGYRSKEIRGMKFLDERGGKPRTPLDWLDQHINRRINELADHVQEYYGDVAMQTLLRELGKIRIVKKGNGMAIE